MKQVILISLLWLALYSTWHSPAKAEPNWGISGFVDTYHAVRVEDENDFLSSRTRLRSELSRTLAEMYVYASFNVIHNALLDSESGIELREAFFQYYRDNWELKAGRQIIIWGVADGLRITDMVSPMDMTEFLARDYDDIRTPVDGFRGRYFNNSLNVDLVYLPIAAFDHIPLDVRNPWSPFSTSGMTYVDLIDDGQPDKTLENGEFGLRTSMYLAGLDMSFAALRTWNKTPVYVSRVSSTGDTLKLEARHARLNILGVDLSRPMGQFVLRGEAAAYLNELHETQWESGGGSVEETTYHFLAGMDWYPSGDWTITGQYINDWIPDRQPGMVSDEHETMATCGITLQFLRNTLKVSTFTYMDLSHESLFNRSYAEYSLTDDLHLLAGLDWFNGNSGSYAIYKNNSEMWMKVKCSF